VKSGKIVRVRGKRDRVRKRGTRVAEEGTKGDQPVPNRRDPRTNFRAERQILSRCYRGGGFRRTLKLKRRASTGMHGHFTETCAKRQLGGVNDRNGTERKKRRCNFEREEEELVGVKTTLIDRFHRFDKRILIG